MTRSPGPGAGPKPGARAGPGSELGPRRPEQKHKQGPMDPKISSLDI